DAFSAAIAATSGTLGVLIPPSIAFLLFGTMTNTSVADLFLAGAIVGTIGMIGYCIAVYFYLRSSKNKPVNKKRFSASEVWKALKESFLGLLSPIIILGGIYSGQFTPTEAAVVSIVYSIVVCMFIYKELSLKDLLNIFIKSGRVAGVVLFLTGVSQIFSWVVAMNGLVKTLTSLVTSLGLGLFGYVLIVNVILLILGMLMDTPPIIILTAPIFLPIAVNLGMNPIHFGAMMVFNLIYGAITPPFGLNVFVANSFSRHLPVTTIFAACKPFFVVGGIMVVLISYVPLFLR
ncbi:MAG: TRAP transporter large permease, partial [Synergistaceae bacterium]|nr:TRAP transporter large permease [Synergistaceae bacterium]